MTTQTDTRTAAEDVHVDDEATRSSTYVPDPHMTNCPSWCDTKHEFGEHPSDRRHRSPVIDVPRTLTWPEVYVTEQCERVADDIIEVTMAQHYREVEPQITLTFGVVKAGGMRGEKVTEDIDLTVDEADALAKALARFVAEARA